MPVISMWRAYKIPLPALVSADPYGTLCTPLLDRDIAEEAVTGIMQQARQAGAHALIFRAIPLDGAAMKAFTEVLRRGGMQPMVLQSHVRACLDATGDADDLLREALGAKKLKELRRQRNRLAEHGAVEFDVARTPAEMATAVETFLTLEASGWKGQRGTALSQDEGDAAFVRRATSALAETGQCEVVTLRAGETPVAAAIVLRHQDRAFYFKLGVDERFAKFSPGVQLTLELTRYLCADPAIRLVDSTAAPDHPMINPIWRGRLAIGDVLIPLRRGDPVVPLIRAALAIARRDPRAGTPHRPFRQITEGEILDEYAHRYRARDYGRSRRAPPRLSAETVRDPPQARRPSAAGAAAYRATRRRIAARPDRIQFRQGRDQPGSGRHSLRRSRSGRSGEKHRNRRRLDGAQARGEFA